MTPLTLNPLQIKAAIISLLVAAVAFLSLTVWAFFERSRYFGCKADSAEIAAQHKILSVRVEEQNAKVYDFESKAKAAQERGRKAVQEAAGRIRNAQADRDRLASELASRAAGKAPERPSSCGDIQGALEAVRKGLTQ